LRPPWATNLQDTISKITRAKWTGVVGQAIQWLLSRHEALSLKKKRKKEGKKEQNSTYLSIITLSVNRLNSSIKRFTA
jgi:hypothetical protein